MWAKLLKQMIFRIFYGVSMKKMLILTALLLSGLGLGAQERGSAESRHKVEVVSWTLTPMDGSRVGAKSPSVDNVPECLGEIRHGKYHAPDGRVLGRRSAVTGVAKELLSVQPEMAPVKAVVGRSAREMVSEAPESELSNWFVDNIMEAVAEVSGNRVDFGVGNFGGIRCAMPQGDIILDDLLSMFPFKNQIVYLELPGSEIRSILAKMAAGNFQVLGGCRVVAEDGKLVSAEIGGEPLDDSRWYGVATISFLLEGGDGLYLSHNSRNMKIYDIDIIDIMLAKVKALTEEGKMVEYSKDGRVVILNREGQI